MALLTDYSDVLVLRVTMNSPAVVLLVVIFIGVVDGFSLSVAPPRHRSTKFPLSSSAQAIHFNAAHSRILRPRSHHRCAKSSSSLLSSSSSSTIVDYLAIDIAEDAPRNIMAFDVLWATDNGIQRCEGFKLSEEDKQARNVYASTTIDLSTGSPILYVPEQLILSSSKAMAELRSPEMKLAERQIANNNGGAAATEYRQYYLMLKLLVEIQKGKDSAWYTWLNSLTRYFTNAPAMTEYCLLCLPPLMRKLVTQERENQRQLSNIQHVTFLNDDIKYHPRDLVKWVYQIVYTRSISVYDAQTDEYNLQIIPMADYFNHSSDDYVEIHSQYDEYGNYMAYAAYDIPANTPLRIQYADPRNPSHLLARYGFLDKTCPSTYCKLLPPTINQDMLVLGYSHDRMLFYKNGSVADEVWDIFLYNYLSSMNAVNDIHTLMEAHRSNDYDTKLALHTHYYPATCAALIEHVNSFITDIDKLITKAETIGVSDGPSKSIYVRNEHPRLPLIHEHNLFVRETFVNVRDRYS